MDPRYIDLARNLVSHSTNVKSGERVLIHSFDIPEEMTIPKSTTDMFPDDTIIVRVRSVQHQKFTVYFNGPSVTHTNNGYTWKRREGDHKAKICLDQASQAQKYYKESKASATGDLPENIDDLERAAAIGGIAKMLFNVNYYKQFHV